MMELRSAEADLLAAYLSPFTDLAGDRRTAHVLGETVRGIIGSESLCCARIAAFSPALAATPHAEQRIRRMVRGETTTRSPFDADDVLARLRTRGVEQLRDESAIWVILDGSDLRKLTEIFRIYRQRWAIEDAFKVGKQCLGWEDVQVLDFGAVRLLVALGWVAAGFLYELGVTLEWDEVRLLRRLGGGEERANRPPGKIILTRGMRRLLDVFATETILAAHVEEYGALPPRIAAILGRPVTG
jgi:hypothetical protein